MRSRRDVPTPGTNQIQVEMRVYEPQNSSIRAYQEIVERLDREMISYRGMIFDTPKKPLGRVEQFFAQGLEGKIAAQLDCLNGTMRLTTYHVLGTFENRRSYGQTDVTHYDSFFQETIKDHNLQFVSSSRVLVSKKDSPLESCLDYAYQSFGMNHFLSSPER